MTIELSLQTGSLIHSITNQRLLDAITSLKQVSPIAKDTSIPVLLRLNDVADHLLEMGKNDWIINALSSYQIIIQSKDGSIFSTLHIAQRPKYSTLYFQTYASTRDAYNHFEGKVRQGFDRYKVPGTIFTLRWAFSGRHGVQDVHITELYDDVVFDECYPDIKGKYGTVENFVKDYMESTSSVLILQGVPGTGKTRLIRNMLAYMKNMHVVSRSEDQEAYNGRVDESETPIAVYTGDKEVLKGQEIFARFVNADENILIIEDADLLLKSRADGNESMHNFLTSADGIIRGKGRKIIFTTNLANPGDIDSALLRPGRCYGLVNIRYLTKAESYAVLKRIFPNDKVELTKEKYTLAELYNKKF